MATHKLYFEPVDLKVNFPELEKELLADWNKKGIVKKYLSKNKNSQKYFSFLDGPITANGPMGVHHAWGRTYKDIWQRFKNMQGFRERFQNGFDCQGLWVEVEVEKELGFKSKKDIEEFGVAKFVELCRSRVKKYSGIQTEQSKRLGYFMDWDNSYFTLSEDNNYMIWNFLKRCYDAGWIYKGNDAVPWCPRCETAISQHEMLTEDYKEITHESVFLAFPVTGQKEEYLLVWTTTPWTVPANIALAVDADLDYSLIEIGKKYYWVAKAAKDRVFADVKVKEVKTTKGAKLVGLRYKGAFDDLPKVKDVAIGKNDKFHTVVATDDMILPVNTLEGTGIIHIAVSAGTEDFKLGQKLGLPMIPIIEDDASYMKNLGFLSGLNAKKSPGIILDYLKKLDEEGRHFIYKTENYTHRYPACWRCKTELVWKVTDEWYIAMDTPSKVKKKTGEIVIEKWSGEEEQVKTPPDTRTLRERMKVVAQKINWLPVFGLDREMDWLTNMHDWLISKKNRYWGLALPIWECKKCHHFEVIGSEEELKERAIEGWNTFAGKSPHKPQIDAVKIKCSKCGAVVSRIEPVGNPWLDAGIVPFSTISEGNKACGLETTKIKPSYLNNREAWQKWFPADFITESFPGQFKNWFYAMIAMSTVLEDVNPFKTVLGYGTLLGEDGRPMHKSWGNMIEFGEGAGKIGVDVMRWMFSRQNPAENMMFGFKGADEVRRRFHLKLWNVYNFFVTYANLDGWIPPKNKKLKIKTENVLDSWILIRLNQTLGLVTQCLERYDAFGACSEIEKFVDDISLWYVRRSRNRVGPAAESEKDREAFYSTIYFVLYNLVKIMAPFTPFMSDTIYKNLTKEESIHLTDWPEMGEEPKAKDIVLVDQMQKVREIVEKAHATRKELGIPVRQPLAKLQVDNFKLQVGDLTKLLLDELNVKEVLFKEGKEELVVRFDTKLTPELKEEAEVRDLTRKIQDERKRLGLNLTQKVDVRLDKLPLSKELIQWMSKKAQISSLAKGKFRVSKSS
jgi:isoleucyl-tRNA synthetase